MEETHRSLRKIMCACTICAIFILSAEASVTVKKYNETTVGITEYDNTALWLDADYFAPGTFFRNSGILQFNGNISDSDIQNYMKENLISGNLPTDTQLYAGKIRIRIGRRRGGSSFSSRRRGRSRGRSSGHRKSYIVKSGRNFLKTSAFENYLKQNSADGGGRRRKSRIVPSSSSFLNSSAFEKYMKKTSTGDR